MTVLLLLLVWLGPPAEIGECDSYDERHAWTHTERMQVRKRIEDACRALGAARIVCEYLDAVAVRESSGMASRRHRRGENEDGLGPLGLSLAWNWDKWPGEDEDPMFCTPEVSVLVALDIIRRAITRYHAEDLLGIQAIYAGHWNCWEDREGKRQCRPDIRSHNICDRMRMRGFACDVPITTKMLGPKVKLADRRAKAAELVAAAEAKAAKAAEVQP